MAEHAIDNREVGASIAPPWTMRPSSNGIGLGPLNRQWQFESARVLHFWGVADRQGEGLWILLSEFNSRRPSQLSLSDTLWLIGIS